MVLLLVQIFLIYRPVNRGDQIVILDHRSFDLAESGHFVIFAEQPRQIIVQLRLGVQQIARPLRRILIQKIHFITSVSVRFNALLY